MMNRGRLRGDHTARVRAFSHRNSQSRLAVHNRRRSFFAARRRSHWAIHENIGAPWSQAFHDPHLKPGRTIPTCCPGRSGAGRLRCTGLGVRLSASPFVIICTDPDREGQVIGQQARLPT